MEAMFRRVFMLLLGIVLGYCAGFNDASKNDRMIHMRAIQRVQNFGSQTMKERERAVEEAGRP